MPLMTIRSAAPIDEAAVNSMLSACSARLAELLAPPEAHVMTLFDRPVGTTMAGTANPCCLVEIRSVVELSRYPFTGSWLQAPAEILFRGFARTATFIRTA